MTEGSIAREVVSATSRRRLVGGALGLVAAAGLRAAGAQDATPKSSSTGIGWSFSDDKGVTIELPERPVRIVADVNIAAPLWDYGIVPVALFGWNASLDDEGKLSAAGGRIDPTMVEFVGDVNEPIRLEDAVAMEPDLILTITHAPDDPLDYWSIDPSVLPQVQAIAPVLALSGTGRSDISVERTAKLAEALGADLSTPEVQAQKERYGAAIAAFSAAAAEQAELTSLFSSVKKDGAIVIANPPDWRDLAWYRALGLNIIDPDAEPLSYWEELSAENALKYPSDILWQSTRPLAMTAEELEADSVWQHHPAVSSGQIGGWNQDSISSYQGMTDALEAMIAVLGSAKVVTE